MKKIFTKNRLVILALAVMIGVAGYLNFNESQKNAESKSNETTGKTADLEVISYLDEDAQAASSDDVTAGEQTEEASVSDAANEAENPDTEEVASLDEEVELNSNEEDIGKAVLTNAEVTQNNVATAKLNREQNRSRSKEALLDIINDESIDEASKEEAVSSYVKLSDTIEKESDTETLLTAKGYQDAIVTISDATVDVALNVDAITDSERAQIEDIVTRKTGYDISQVVISLSSDK